MIVYIRAKEISLTGFDLNRGIKRFNRIKDIREISHVSSKETNDLISSTQSDDDIFSTFEYSSKSRRRRSSEKFSGDEVTFGSSGIKSPKTLSTSIKRKFGIRTSSQERKDNFPRVESFVVFAKDRRKIQKNQEAILDKKTQPKTMGSNSKEILTSQQHAQAFERFAMRLMISYYASLKPDDMPVLYVKAILCACEMLDEVYAADQRFFSAAYEKLLFLGNELFNARASFKQLTPFCELTNSFVIRAQAKGLLSSITKTSLLKLYSTRRELSSQELLSEVLLDEHFLKVKNTVDAIKRVEAKKELDSEVVKELENAREYYLQNE